MMLESDPDHGDQVNRAIETTIHIGLLIAMVGGVLLILRPFIPLALWGVIIAIAAHPTYLRFQKLLHGRRTLAAILFSCVLLAILIIPLTLLTGSVVDGVQNIITKLKDGTPIIPPPPARVGTWPLIGVPLSDAWQLASSNLSAALQSFAPQIKPLLSSLFLASASIGLEALQWFFAILLAGVLLANDAKAARASASISKKLLGERGPEVEALASSTIRSVTRGIIGVALIQSLCAALGFFIAGLPGAGLWSVVFLVAALLQVGVIVLIPAVIYYFAIATATHGTMFLAWCAIVGVMDNFLKPLLLGRQASVPIIVVFVGTIGGFIALGAIGFFVGSVVVSVGYNLFLSWIEDRNQRSSLTLNQEASLHSGA